MKNSIVLKKIVLILCLTAITVSFGQETENKKESITNKKNEFKFGALSALFSGIYLSYEQIHSKDFTYGASIFSNQDEQYKLDTDFELTGFARFYFQETKEYGAYGYFVEGYLQYVNGKKYDNFWHDSYINYSSPVFGFGLGKKWVNHSGFVLETFTGGGRTIGNKNAPDFTLRFNVSLGYRF